MVVVPHGRAELDHEGWVPDAPQGRGREESALEAVRLACLEDAAWRTCRLAVPFLVVEEIVQKALDRVG